MTTDEVKEELKGYEHDYKMMESIEKQVEVYRSKLSSCTSKISATPKGSPDVQDKIAEYIAKLEELEILKYTRLVELENKKELIEKTIMKLKQPYKRILHLVYIEEWQHQDAKGTEKIEIGYGLPIAAAIMGFEYKYFCKLHGIALLEYIEVRDNDVSHETSEKR